MSNNIKFIIVDDIPENAIWGISDKSAIGEFKNITGQYGLKVKSKISIVTTKYENNKRD
jgi:hypothetical protein